MFIFKNIILIFSLGSTEELAEALDGLVCSEIEENCDRLIIERLGRQGDKQFSSSSLRSYSGRVTFKKQFTFGESSIFTSAKTFSFSESDISSGKTKGGGFL